MWLDEFCLAGWRLVFSVLGWLVVWLGWLKWFLWLMCLLWCAVLCGLVCLFKCRLANLYY